MIKLKAELSNLPTFIELAHKKALEFKFNKSSIMQIELALEEVIVNIINYAYDENIGYIEFSCDVDNDKIVMTIVDNGKPFDMMCSKAPNIEASLDERKIGGLGIFFVKELMDKVEYKRLGNDNILILIKNKAEE